MCNRYVSPQQAAIERYWSATPKHSWQGTWVAPRKPGPFLRSGPDGLEMMVGRWGLIPWFAKTPIIQYVTNNARSEELSQKASFKHPWARGQRCLIPALSFDEPCWETGKNVWWTFRRADGKPWALAGLWSAWTDSQTGEVVESYTMLTINADGHPLMGRMHKPDPALPPDGQDKRSVISIERCDEERWLKGNLAEATELLRVPEAGVFDASPMGV